MQTSRDRYGSPLRGIPGTIDLDSAITYVNTFGKSRPSIFASVQDVAEPAQLVVVLEGVTAENVEPLRQSLAKSNRQQQPAFMVSDPPSATANDQLLAELRGNGVANKHSCTIEAALNPNEKSCWDGLSSVVRYDVQKVRYTSLGISQGSNLCCSPPRSSRP